MDDGGVCDRLVEPGGHPTFVRLHLEVVFSYWDRWSAAAKWVLAVLLSVEVKRGISRPVVQGASSKCRPPGTMTITFARCR